MIENEYSKLDTEKLLVQKEKIKTKKFLFGFVIATSFISFAVLAILNGMSIFTFLPLSVAFLAMKSIEKMHALEAALNARGLE